MFPQIFFAAHEKNVRSAPLHTKAVENTGTKAYAQWWSPHVLTAKVKTTYFLETVIPMWQLVSVPSG
jgi:hypothetical protein